MTIRKITHRALVVLLCVAVCANALPKNPAWLGIGYTYHRGAVASALPWLHVRGLDPKGPAKEAGIRVQDIITAIDNRPVWFANEAEALAFFLYLEQGREVTFSIMRQNKRLVVHVKTVPLPKEYYSLWEANVKSLKR